MRMSERAHGAAIGGAPAWVATWRCWALAVLLAAVACQGGEQAQPIVYGEQRCDQCGQVIADRRFAAQFRGGDGAWHAFDDPGCLFAALHETPAASAFFFHDHDGEGWISSEDLYLVRIPGGQSPRGHGWFALANFSAAQDAVTSAGSGEVLRFADAREKLP